MCVCKVGTSSEKERERERTVGSSPPFLLFFFFSDECNRTTVVSKDV